MWRNSWTAEQNRLFSLQSEVNELPQARGNVLRVNQLDAVQLDNDLLSVLKVQFLKIFNASHGLDDRLMPEIDALLQLLVLHFTMFSDRPTPGNKLQNLHYQSDAALLGACCVVPHAALSVWQKLGYAAVVVGGRWAWARLRRYITALRWAECAENTWRKKFWRSAGLVENIFQVATLINLVVFLMQGRYRSLADRLLGLRLVYIQALTVRNVNFDFMNRQLVWHGFAEVVLFVLPLLNLTKVKNIIVRVFGGGARAQETAQVADDVCAVCLQPATTAYHALPCGHRFCYYCLHGSLLADSGFVCPRDGRSIAGTVPASATSDSVSVPRGAP